MSRESERENQHGETMKKAHRKKETKTKQRAAIQFMLQLQCQHSEGKKGHKLHFV